MRSGKRNINSRKIDHKTGQDNAISQRILAIQAGLDGKISSFFDIITGKTSNTVFPIFLDILEGGDE
jgi:hypothetical protein